MRDVVFLVGSAVICAYATTEGLQFLAIAAFVSATGIAYKPRLKSVYAVALDLVRHTSSARDGKAELQLDRAVADVARHFGESPAWVRILAHDLEPRDIGQLLELHKREPSSPRGPALDVYRKLTVHGLLEHDSTGLIAAPTTVSLTVLGDEFVQFVLADGPGTTGVSNADA